MEITSEKGMIWNTYSFLLDGTTKDEYEKLEAKKKLVINYFEYPTPITLTNNPNVVGDLKDHLNKITNNQTNKKYWFERKVDFV